MAGAAGKILGMDKLKAQNLLVAGGLTSFVGAVYFYTMKAVGSGDDLQEAVQILSQEKQEKQENQSKGAAGAPASAITEKITKETSLFPAPINHVLVNEYLPGQGITSHEDDPVYHPVVDILSVGAPTLMHFTPHTRLTEARNNDGSREEDQGEKERKVEAMCSLVLMPGSLLLFKDSAYAEYLHGIDEAYEDLLDDKVVNLDSYLSHKRGKILGLGDDVPQLNLEKGIGSHKDLLKWNGTRISLTCRRVSKVYKNLLRL